MKAKSYTLATSAPWVTLGQRLANVDSTNRELQSRVQLATRESRVLPEGYNLRAGHQTAGRGRLGRQWEGKPGENLYVSYLVDAAGLKATQLFTLSQNVALAVRDTVAALCSTAAPQFVCSVKWPNDVFIGSLKVAGVLIEASLAAEAPLYVVVGIGVNVNQTSFDDAPLATSLRQATGHAFDVDEVWGQLTRRLETGHRNLQASVGTGDLYPISQRYHQHLFGYRQWGRYRNLLDDTHLVARSEGVDARGQLLLHSGDADHRFSMDQIRYEGAASST